MALHMWLRLLYFSTLKHVLVLLYFAHIKFELMHTCFAAQQVTNLTAYLRNTKMGHKNVVSQVLNPFSIAYLRI